MPIIAPVTHDDSRPTRTVPDAVVVDDDDGVVGDDTGASAGGAASPPLLLLLLLLLESVGRGAVVASDVVIVGVVGVGGLQHKSA